MEIIIQDKLKAELFINIFQNIKLFSDIFTIDINEETFYIQGMDASHVSIFEINLTRDWFDTYNVSSSTSLGINSSIFPKILNTWTCDHNIKLKTLICKSFIIDSSLFQLTKHVTTLL